MLILARKLIESISHQPNGLSTTWDAGKIPSVQNEQNINMLATYAGDKNLGQVDENEESMRPKSRRGRAKPIKPTGRYPWQQEEHEDEMEDKVSTHVKFLDAQSPSKPDDSKKDSPNRKQRKIKQSLSPVHRISATNLDTFVERNRRAVAYNPSTKNAKPKPPPPPPMQPKDAGKSKESKSYVNAENKKVYSKIPPWSNSVKTDTFNVKQNKAKNGHEGLQKVMQVKGNRRIF